MDLQLMPLRWGREYHASTPSQIFRKIAFLRPTAFIVLLARELRVFNNLDASIRPVPCFFSFMATTCALSRTSHPS
jgi:hypothetical protein